uniref:Uncharacterized protein n=1 Tax=Globodera rostochiensis TaxID=31243 RepID=A0A914HFD4_GLORO
MRLVNFPGFPGMIGMPCRPLFLLISCLTLLFIIVALKAEIGNLVLPHSPSLKNVAIAIESADQSSSDGNAETGTMTVSQLASKSGFGINLPLATALLLVFGLLEVAMSAFVGKLKSKIRPLLLIIFCLSVVQSVGFRPVIRELPPQLQRAKECQEVKTLCSSGRGKCTRKEGTSASPCCVANYTFECHYNDEPYPGYIYPLEKPVNEECGQKVKYECVSCGHGSCVFVGYETNTICCDNHYEFQCCTNATKEPTSAPFEITEEKYCNDKAKILEICKVCDFYTCSPFTGFHGSACCADHYLFTCCVTKPVILSNRGGSPMSTTPTITTISTTTTPTTTGCMNRLPTFETAKLTTDTCQNKSIIKAVCTECDSYRCMPNSVGFSDSGCCPEDNEYRCCSMDRLITKQPTTTSTPLCNKAIIKAICKKCDFYRCIPNPGFRGGECCYPGHEFRCCSRDAPPFGASTTTTTTTTTTALTTTAPTTTTSAMSTTTTTEPEQETPSTEPSSTAESGADVETISSTTIFCLVMSLWAMERLVPI